MGLWRWRDWRCEFVFDGSAEKPVGELFLYQGDVERLQLRGVHFLSAQKRARQLEEDVRRGYAVASPDKKQNNENVTLRSTP